MKKLLFFLVAFWSLYTSAQNISSKRWTDLFSYNNVLVIREDEGKLIAATENGLFYYTPATGEITKLSKANGLHEVKITAFDYNAATKTGLVGYASGALDVITPAGITYVVDIPIATGYNGDKKINHISISGERAVISTGYGVSVFELTKKEFGDTAFFSDGGAYEPVRGAAIKDNTVYAATAAGLKKHVIDVTFAIYSSWQTADARNVTHVAAGATVVYALGQSLYSGDGESFSQLGALSGSASDLVIVQDDIIATADKQISLFSANGTQTQTKNFQESLNTGFVAGGKIFAGSLVSGILDEGLQKIKPDGPYNNSSYNISIQGDKLWVSSGNRKDRYNGASPPAANIGFYHYTGTEWIYPSYFVTNNLPFNVMDVVANPTNQKEVFFANYTTDGHQGIYKMMYDENSKDFEFVKRYGKPAALAYDRPIGLQFDEYNNLFGAVAYYNKTTDTALMVYDRSSDKFEYRSVQVREGAQKPVIADGFIWLPIPRTSNLVVTDYKRTAIFSDDTLFNIGRDNGLPASAQGVLSFAMDKSGDAWIGTDSGVRVLSAAASAVRNDPRVEPIIIEENGVGEELFRDSSVLQITVDGGNQKWLSVAEGGVFYLSPNGERTISHFTKENSPLPNNSVTDIKVDERTGKVYFVTLDGIVVYQGDVVDVTENFGNVLVYPNPVVYSQYKGNVRIRGLAEKTNIRITDAAGNLVHQAVARGGSYEWNLANNSGMRVASGIYFVLMTNADGTDTATAKIAVVN